MKSNCFPGFQLTEQPRSEPRSLALLCTDDKQRIERAGGSIVIYRRSREGLCQCSCDLAFDFGLEIPFLFTEGEAGRVVLVSEVSHNSAATRWLVRLTQNLT